MTVSTSSNGSDGIIRRTRRRPFIPPTPDAENTVVSRELLSRGKGKKSQLPRNRKIAGDLPTWEPLPPGEIVVRRGEAQSGR
ncbi:hypothetical protein [Mycobacterium sp. 1274756.6]|uniref:hypothetical protein n=1 Tax=Mycobacterium sp. 1274756.6 TaxID=1834076 RepID=UPI000AECCC4A|nr:hypothetical protein [Mycobacterium sp. 1274756.6]